MTARTWTLELPYLAPPLRDNDRMHWAPKARWTATLRRDAAVLARSYRLPIGLTHVAVTLHWQPATNRRRDPLSAAPTLKPLVDGLVDYGLIPDDDTRHVSLTCTTHDWRKGTPGRSWLTITETDPSTPPASADLSATGQVSGRMGGGL